MAIYISKIENGFLVTVRMKGIDKQYYCKDLEAIHALTERSVEEWSKLAKVSHEEG